MMSQNGGCSYGKVTRNMVENLDKKFEHFEKYIKTEFEDLKKTNTRLYNHLSSRLPPWAVAIGGLGIALISAMGGAIVKSILG